MRILDCGSISNSVVRISVPCLLVLYTLLVLQLSVRGRFTDGCGIGFGFFEGNVQRGSLNFLVLYIASDSLYILLPPL